MPSNTAARLLRAFTFHPDGWISIGCFRWATTVPVSTRHSRTAYSGCLSACTGKSTLATDLDSPSARRPSSRRAAACGWNRHPGRDRHSISLCRRGTNLPGTINHIAFERSECLSQVLKKKGPTARFGCTIEGDWKTVIGGKQYESAQHMVSSSLVLGADCLCRYCKRQSWSGRHFRTPRRHDFEYRDL